MWLYLLPRPNTTNAFPSQHLCIDFAVLDSRLKSSEKNAHYSFPPALIVEFGDLLPGQYNLKAIWRKRPNTSDPRHPYPLHEGDLIENNPIQLTIRAGETCEPPPLRCDRKVD